MASCSCLVEDMMSSTRPDIAQNQVDMSRIWQAFTSARTAAGLEHSMGTSVALAEQDELSLRLTFNINSDWHNHSKVSFEYP